MVPRIVEPLGERVADGLLLRALDVLADDGFQEVPSRGLPFARAAFSSAGPYVRSHTF